MKRYTKKEIEEMRAAGISVDERGKPDTVGKTENFFTRNVKLITFLCCMAIFLTFFGPFSVFYIKEWIEERSDTRVAMTTEDLLILSELDRPVKYEDLRGYKMTETINSIDEKVELGNGETEIRERPVAIYLWFFNIDGRYNALAVFDYDTRVIKYFKVTDIDRGMEADLLVDNMSDFFAGIPKKTTAVTTAAKTTAEES